MFTKDDIKNQEPVRVQEMILRKIDEVKASTDSDFDKMIEISVYTAVLKGWHDEDRNVGELIALCHSELSEVLEEFRKPEVDKAKIAEETADLIIRVMDLVWYIDIDLKEAIIKKMVKNLSRPYKHGKRF